MAGTVAIRVARAVTIGVTRAISGAGSIGMTGTIRTAVAIYHGRHTAWAIRASVTGTMAIAVRQVSSCGCS